jgi:hypothetical protein
MHSLLLPYTFDLLEQPSWQADESLLYHLALHANEVLPVKS